MLPWRLPASTDLIRTADTPRLRVAAVGFLNTSPLVWGLLHGPRKGEMDVEFCTPAECANRLESARADIGIVPVVELARLGLGIIPGCCIASRGPVRSILLISKVAPRGIRTLAADTSSRTSVALARIVLAERHGAEPQLLPMAPDLPAMLEAADAALLIGDPALRLNVGSLPYQVLDLGAEWTAWTGKPMVFAVWAGRPELPLGELERTFRASAAFGRERIEEIVRIEGPARGIPDALAREYLTRRIVFELGENELEGMSLFLDYAARGVAA